MATQLSGQITVTTAGTEVQGSDIPAYSLLRTGGFFVRALSTNTGKMYVATPARALFPVRPAMN